MADLKTKYLGLELSNPIIVGASGLTGEIESIQKLAKNGAGAIVLKSLFEEQIILDLHKSMSNYENMITHAEAQDHFRAFEKQFLLDKYLNLIKDAKSKTNIPIIASINCFTTGEWTSFAKQIEAAGADALELNIFILPSEVNRNANYYEENYFSIIKNVKKVINIPVALKISSYFTNFGHILKRFSDLGADGIVLFNRFVNIDIDIENEMFTHADTYTSSSDFANTLRWIAISSGIVDCDISASTGVVDGHAVIKAILAGANAVQMVSAVYKDENIIQKSLAQITEWMQNHHYENISDFRGKIKSDAQNSEFIERTQFLQYFGNHK